jgi:hypothetical protein
MKKTVLTFGSIAGAILSVMMLVTIPWQMEIGFEMGEIFGYSSMVLAFLLIYFGVRSYRDNASGGTISFGRALKVGALIAAVASGWYVATWQVMYYKLTPDFGEKYIAYNLEKARADGETEEQIAKRKADMEKFAELYKNPAVNIAITFLEPLPVALVMALVSAGVLSRRRENEPEIDTASRRVLS